MQRKQVHALSVAAGLVGWSLTAGLEIPGRRHPLLQAALAAGLVVLTRAPLGLRPPALVAGLRWGSVAAGAVTAVVSAATLHPRVSAGMAEREIPDRPERWLALDIPLGTVWSEEAAYRAALGSVAADAFGPGTGRLVQATAFGLSHIHDARLAGAPVVPIVLVTGVAGWVFGWLADRSGSLAAPMLAHLATNEAGAVAPLVVQASR